MHESDPRKELDRAYQARVNGNEGMARVLARRAAGLALRNYLQGKKSTIPTLSLNATLHDESIRQLLPHEILAALDRLCTRVNTRYQLPFEEDLLVDTRMIIETLENTGEKNG